MTNADDPIVYWLRCGTGLTSDKAAPSVICKVCGAFVYQTLWDEHVADHERFKAVWYYLKKQATESE